MRLAEGSFQDDEISSNLDGVNQYDSVFQNVPENPRYVITYRNQSVCTIVAREASFVIFEIENVLIFAPKINT